MATKKKTFYEWLSTRANLTIRNEENYALKKSVRFSYAQVLVFGSVFFILFSLFSLWVSTKVIGIWYNPRQDYFNTKKKVIRLALSVDSLEEQIRQKELFISHIQNIVETGTAADTALPHSGKTEDVHHAKPQIETVDLDYLPEVDSAIRVEFETNSSLHSSGSAMVRDNLHEILLLPPVKGSVTEKFSSRTHHYGVDIVAQKDEPVKAVEDGVVIFASWTDDTEYVIGIQHANSLVSFYKHNAILLKNVGSAVKSGDIIATIGTAGELTTGPHLYFELWYKGSPVDPKSLIYF